MKPVNQLPAYNPEATKVGCRYPSVTAHRCLLVATTVLSVLSYALAKHTMFPNLLLRNVALVSSAFIATDGFKQNDGATNLMNVARVSAVALGVIGVVAARPACYVVSLATDVALETLQLGRALYNREGQAGFHLLSLTVSSLVLGSIVIGTWEFAVAAAAVNAVYMCVMAGYSLANGEDLDFLCYLVLMGLSHVEALQVKTMKTSNWKKIQYDVKNDTNKKMTIHYNGQYITTLKPGEKMHITITKNKIALSTGETMRTYWSGDKVTGTIYEKGRILKKRLFSFQPNPKMLLRTPIGGTQVVDRKRD